MTFGKLRVGSFFTLAEPPAQGATGMLNNKYRKHNRTHAEIVGVKGVGEFVGMEDAKFLGEFRHFHDACEVISS